MSCQTCGLSVVDPAEPEGVETGASGGGDPASTGATLWVNRSEDCPAAPGQVHPLARGSRGVRLYIAGPMTGLPDFNFPAFNDAESHLVAAGFKTLNPARHGAGEPGMTWADYMRRDIPDVLAVDGIALLDGWENSRGASLEVHIATALDLPVRPLNEWLATHQTPGHPDLLGGERAAGSSSPD